MARTGWALLATLLAVGVAALPPPPARVDPARLTPAHRYDVRILRDTWGVPHVLRAHRPRRRVRPRLGARRGRLRDHPGRAAGRARAPGHRLRPRRARPTTTSSSSCASGTSSTRGYETRPPARHARALRGLRGRDQPLRGAASRAGAWPRSTPRAARTWSPGFVHKLPLFFGLDEMLDRPARASRRPSPPPPAPGVEHVRGRARAAPRTGSRGCRELAPAVGGPGRLVRGAPPQRRGLGRGGRRCFPARPLILHGHNRDLGWAHTVNHPDLIDVYALEIEPREPAPVPLRRRLARPRGAHGADRGEAAGPAPLDLPARGALVGARPGPPRAARARTPCASPGWGDVRAGRAVVPHEPARARSTNGRTRMRLRRAPHVQRGLRGRARATSPTSTTRACRGGRKGSTGRRRARETRRRRSGRTTCRSTDLPRVVDPPSGFVQNCNGSPFRTTTGDGNPDPAAVRARARASRRA